MKSRKLVLYIITIISLLILNDKTVLSEQRDDEERPGIAGGFFGNALDFAFFHKGIPNVNLDVLTGIIHEGKRYFVVSYVISYPPKGIAKFPDGGMPRYEVQRLYLFACEEPSKAITNLGEIRYPCLNYRNPDVYINLAPHREDILIGAHFECKEETGRHFEIKEEKIVSWKSILSYNLSDKSITELVRDAWMPIVSPDQSNMLFRRGDDLMLYNFKMKSTDFLAGNVKSVKWADNANLLLNITDSETVISLNIIGKKAVKSGTLIKNINPMAFFANRREVSRAETESISDIAFFNEYGMPDPIQYIRGSKSSTSLAEIACGEADHSLRLAITGKLLRENRRDLVDKILAGIDKDCEKKTSSGSNHVIADTIRRDFEKEKASIRKIADNYQKQ